MLDKDDLIEEGLGHPWLVDWETAIRSLQASSERAHVRVVAAGTRFYQQAMHLVPEAGRVRIYGTDITELKSVERSLHESQATFRNVFDAINDVVLIHDLVTGRILSANEKVAEMFGYTVDEIRSLTIGDLSAGTSPYSQEDAVARLQRVVHQGSPQLFEWRSRHRSGRLFWVEVNLRSAVIDGRPIIVAVVRDITERKEAEERLRTSDARLRSIFEHAPMSMAIVRLDGTIEYFNRKAFTTFGFSPSDLPTMEQWWLLAHPNESYRREVIATWTGLIEKALAEHHDIEGREYRVTCRDGTVKTMLILGVPVADRIFVMFEDITERKQAEERVRTSEERLSLAIAASGFGLWDWDLTADRAYLSPEYLQLVGYPDGDIRSARSFFRGLVHPDDLPVVEQTMEEHLQGRRPRSVIDYRMRKESGEYFWVHGVGQVTARDSSGAPLRMTGVIADVTERKHLEEELRERQALLLEAGRLVHLGYWDRDLRNGRSYWSDEVHRILGHAPGSVLPSREAFLGSIVAEDRGRIAAEINATAGDGVTRRAEYRVVEAQGGVRSLFGTVELLRDSSGAPARIIGTVQDITERKTAEAERERLLEALRETDRRKDEFLAVLSHELRNPLMPIRSSVFLLSKNTSLDERGRRATAVIDRQMSHLARLVDDLLDVTRITRGKIRLRRARLDLVDVVRRAAEDHRSLLEAHDVVVELPKEAVWIDGDSTRLSQVIGNLLNNAAKFTPTSSRITVSLSHEESGAVLEVADTGVGIDPDTLKRLFEPFAQADRSLDRSKGGLGLGLALVKGLVEMHGGEVHAYSGGPGQGARFTIRLPLDKREKPEPATRQAAPAHQAGHGARRVLIIEDNRDAADGLREILESAGHTIAVAYDGSKGLEKARTFGPEIVLCDIGLPAGMDGYAVARALRQDPATASAYLVALTGYALPEDRRRALDAGFDAHLAKPPDLATLEQLLAQAPALVASSSEGAATP